MFVEGSRRVCVRKRDSECTRERERAKEKERDGGV